MTAIRVRVRPLLGSLALSGVAGLAAAALAQTGSTGWTIPADAPTIHNPNRVSRAVTNYGRTLYGRHCRACHGPLGKGDGTQASPDHFPGDLTDPGRTAENPDGVLYYKIWNGSRMPPMPAFREKLTREETWAVVEYIKTLRR
jgi:copper transport protein